MCSNTYLGLLKDLARGYLQCTIWIWKLQVDTFQDWCTYVPKSARCAKWRAGEIPQSGGQEVGGGAVGQALSLSDGPQWTRLRHTLVSDFSRGNSSRYGKNFNTSIGELKWEKQNSLMTFKVLPINSESSEIFRENGLSRRPPPPAPSHDQLANSPRPGTVQCNAHGGPANCAEWSTPLQHLQTSFLMLCCKKLSLWTLLPYLFHKHFPSI